MSSVRELSHAAQGAALRAVKDALPLEFGVNHTVLDFGEIKVENEAPEFHNIVQIYPLGYRCTVKVPSLRSLKGETALFEFQIQEKDGGPLFVIKGLTPGQTYESSTEKGALKKLEALGGYGGDEITSFFTLEVELLIEGLEGALECVDYQFHEERGYPSQYDTQEQLEIMRTALLNNSARERRKARRDVLKQLSPEEQRRAEVLEKRRVQEEKEQEKLQQVAERQRKKLLLDAAKKEKEIANAEAKRLREAARKLKKEADETAKAEEKERRERAKVEEKYRTLYRRAIKQEVKKCRQEAMMRVLAYSDREDNRSDDHEMRHYERAALAAAGPKQVQEMERIVTNAPSCDAALLPDAIPAGSVCWDAAVYVINGLYLFRKQLDIHFPCTIENVVRGLALVSSNMPVRESKLMDVAGTNTTETDISLATAMVDRIHIRLSNAFLDTVHGLLELQDRVPEPKGGERGGSKIKLVSPIHIPLNQLTWAEVARMALLRHCFSFLPSSAVGDVSSFAARGGRGPSWRTNKNVIRRIRYRWYLRRLMKRSHKTSEYSGESGFSDRLLKHRQANESPARVEIKELRELPEGAKDFFSRPAVDSDFESDAGLFSNVESIMTSEAFPDSYRRCAAVLYRIVQLSCAKYLLWDILYEEMPQYFDIIKRPVCLANVAMHLLNRSYDEALDLEASSSEQVVCSMFYAEMQSVFLNCYAFNTEAQGIVPQAQKTHLAFFRHMNGWVLSESRPSLDKCTEGFCFLTERAIDSMALMRCGHCCANYHLESLSDAYLSGNIYVVPVAQELVDSNHSEWVCPACMQEDTCFEVRFSSTESACYLDEYGPSIGYPWQLNPQFSLEASRLQADSPSFSVCIEALAILADPARSSVANSAKSRDSRLDDQREVEAHEHAARSVRTWTLREHVTVLHALLFCYGAETKQANRIAQLQTKVEELYSIAAQPMFREGEFLRIADDITNDVGALRCRQMLDQIVGDKIPRGDIHKIFDGRCVVCKSSTFPEDQQNNSDDEDDSPKKRKNEVILCDACNSEAHLRCLGLNSVPSGDFFCDDCKMRKAGHTHNPDLDITGIRQLRDATMEEDLVNRKIDKVAASEGHSVLTKDELRPELDTSRLECIYCGTTETHICSPMVVSQPRLEHDWHLKPLRQTAPYFPYYTSEDGDDMLELHRTHHKSIGTLAAHQMCALELFRARVSPNAAFLRRMRRKVVRFAVELSGLMIAPLGRDNKGREYWKFPTSEALFICRGLYGDSDKHQFLNLLGKERGRSVAMKAEISAKKQEFHSSNWLLISDVTSVWNLLNNLGPSLVEQKLRKALFEAYPVDDLSKQAESFKQTSDEETQQNWSMHVDDQGNGNTDPSDNLPVAIELQKSKGASIEATVEIASEGVLSEATGDEEEDTSEYFDFGKRYYAIALLNKFGKKVRPKKGAVTVTCQVHHSSSHVPLASTPLTEIWSDGMFYFSTAVFRRSGQYTISFVVEGLNAKNIDPLIYHVAVTARATKAGPEEALQRLEAVKWLHDSGRRVLIPRLKRSLLISKLGRCNNEFESVRSAILTIFAALPAGSLPPVMVDDRSRSKKKEVCEARNEELTEAPGWNDAVEDAWFEVVTCSREPAELMEAALMLQYHIAPKTFTELGMRLLGALPSAHAAMRMPTLSSVALRLFSIDRALQYDKVIEEPRAKRSNDVQSTVGKISRWEPEVFNSTPAPAPTRVSGRKRGADYFDEDEIERAKLASLEV
eukprot:GSChrysophyteH1.ASY1.ANO1.484.1 assembled CDS